MRPLVLAILLLVPMSLAQQTGLKKSTRKPVKLTGQQGPVTHQEANATFARVDKLITLLPGLKSYKPAARPSKPGLVSRNYIIAEMNKIFEKIKPTFKFTPMAVRYEPSRLVASPQHKPFLGKLVQWGFIGKVSPLATGPKDTIGLREFGDAVGLFMARVSDLTHSPDIKYSPWMKDKIGG